jgi:hypothetical protein
MRRISRCQGWSRGAAFSRKYRMFSCGNSSSARRRMYNDLWRTLPAKSPTGKPDPNAERRRALLELPQEVGGAALVHHLGLALGIEILRHVADDAQDLALPGLSTRRPTSSSCSRTPTSSASRTTTTGATAATTPTPGHDPVVVVGGAALVHHLGLALGIEILRQTKVMNSCSRTPTSSASRTTTTGATAATTPTPSALP